MLAVVEMEMMSLKLQDKPLRFLVETQFKKKFINLNHCQTCFNIGLNKWICLYSKSLCLVPLGVLRSTAGGTSDFFKMLIYQSCITP